MNFGALMQLAPTVLSFLGGPAGGIAGAGLEFLAGKLGASDKTVGAVQTALSGMTPADTIALKKLDLDFQQFCMDNAIKVDMAQIGVDDDEAKSSSTFVGGWRPFVGWVCGLGLAYVALIEPLSRFIAQVGFHYAGQFPVIDTTLTMQVLLGMLGMGYLHSQDKKNGVE